MGDGIQRYAPCDECSCLDMRDGEGAYVLFTDHEKAVAAALARASASGVTKNLGVETKRMEDENLD